MSSSEEGKRLVYCDSVMEGVNMVKAETFPLGLAVGSDQGPGWNSSKGNAFKSHIKLRRPLH